MASSTITKGEIIKVKSIDTSVNITLPRKGGSGYYIICYAVGSNGGNGAFSLAGFLRFGWEIENDRLDSIFTTEYYGQVPLTLVETTENAITFTIIPYCQFMFIPFVGL